jgi:hypothetical protein
MVTRTSPNCFPPREAKVVAHFVNGSVAIASTNGFRPAGTAAFLGGTLN